MSERRALGSRTGRRAVPAFAVAAIVAFSAAASAEMVKTATVTGSGMEFHWWPKLKLPHGWHQENESSRHYGAAALAPDGESFADAQTVMYAAAPYKPREKKWPTIAAMIAGDRAKFMSDDPRMQIQKITDLVDADGQHLQTYSFAPGNHEAGNWEAVAYGEEDDFYLIFTISSRTEAGYRKNFPIFTSLVRNYAKILH